MIYNVATLLKSSVGSSIHVPVEGDIDLESDDVSALSPVLGEAKLQRTNQGVLATGNFDVTVELQCVRCLEIFSLPLQIEFSEIFQPTVIVTTGVPLPPITDDDTFAIDDHHHLDLAEPIRQQIILALPTQSICRDDCQGLCPICGKNRNEESCEHEGLEGENDDQHPDPWAQLRGLN
jgi:uncharacterized protein